jgi:light-independent protochlorophyllide reductase subunit N
MVAYSGSGIETTFTQGEDSCLAELARNAEASAPGERRLLVAGTLSDVVEDQFRRLFDELGIGPVAFPAGAQRGRYPRVGPGTRLLLAQPYLTETVAALTNRGARNARCPLPPRGRRHARLAAGRGTGLGCEPGALRRGHRRARGIAPGAPSPHSVKRWPVGASRSSRTRSWRCRWRASCSASAAMQVTSVATPFHDPQLMAAEQSLFDPPVPIIEGGDVEKRLDAVRDSAPDLTVCGLGIANPLEAEGLRTKWSIELIFSPIQGFRAGRRSRRPVQPSAAAPGAAGGLRGWS